MGRSILKKQIKKGMDYNKALAIVVFAALYVSQETTIFGTNSDSHFTLIGMLSWVLFAIVCAIRIFKTKQQNISYLISLSGLILLSALVNFDFSGGLALQISVLLVGYYIAGRFPFVQFAVTFERLLYWIALSSLVIYILFLVVPGVFSIFPRITSGNGLSYINVFISRISLYNPGSPFMRNSSFFREPGVYMIFLVTALIVQLFYLKKKNNIHIVTFLAAIFTTFSTAGYVITITLFGFFYLSRRGANALIYIMAFSGLLIALYLNFNDHLIFTDTFGKFNEDSSKYASTVSRYASVQVPLQMIFEKPILGVGLSEFVRRFSEYSWMLMGADIHSGGASTNTILNLTATYGLIYGVIVITMLFKGCKQFNTSADRRRTLMIFVILLLVLSNEDIRYSVFFTALLFYGVVNGRLNKYNISTPARRV